MSEKDVRRLETMADQKSNGDPVLAEVLLMHLHYNWGKGSNPRKVRINEAYVVNGVQFWCVGHNASHEFYAGTDGSGKRFRYSVGESCRLDMDGNPIVLDETGLPKVPAGLDRDFKEVPDFRGYYGHF